MRQQHPRTCKDTTTARWVAAGVCAASVAIAPQALAQQNDVNPPLPNVLLLLDSSGSMELMMDNCNPDNGLYPDGSGGGTCNGEIPNPATYCDGKTTVGQNRWGAEVAALTGTFASSPYSCVSMSRQPGSNQPFLNEYSLKYSGGGSVAPYDANYYLNYHRPSQYTGHGTITCVMGFDQSATTGWSPDNAVTHPGTSDDFNKANIQGYEFDTSTGQLVSPLTTCNFRQNADGLIPAATSSVRFALMTFDNDTLPFTGVTGTDGTPWVTGTTFQFADVAASVPPTSGMWSYFNGWASGISGATIGRPAGCALDGVSQIPYEVGARNPAAPPWEGRMVRFPGSTDDPTTTNSEVAKAIAVMRPYGANPIAGMMDDAKYYLWSDPEGPATLDLYNSCRSQYIILLSHAAPNLDLQTYCQGTALGSVGKCPYDYPEYIAAGLASGNYTPGAGVQNAQSASAHGQKIQTFVVGFSVKDPTVGATTLSCSDVLVGSPPTIDATKCGTEILNGVDAGSNATDPNAAAYASCCALARIAVAGGTQTPYFADNAADLAAALQKILGIIVASESTRTTPVTLPQTANTTSSGGAATATFVSSFNVSTNVPWSGNVVRNRYACSSSNGTWGEQQQPVSDNAGDDFAYNMQNTQSGTRHVIAVQPTTPSTAGVTLSGAGNIRPYVTDNSGASFDHYSEYDGTEHFLSYSPSSSAAAIDTTQITPLALGLANPVAPAKTTCKIQEPDMAAPFGSNTDNTACETIMLNYMLGTTTPAVWTGTSVPFPARYYNTSTQFPSSPFGGVFHSEPAVATPPSALLRDDSYQAFITNNTTNYVSINGVNKPRHSVLYVATIDGLLHAFGVDYNSGDPYTFNGSHVDDYGNTGLQNEMWSFIPPATMAKLGAAGGSLQATGRLDGSPVVKDTVYQRSIVGTASDWHTTLVAGFGPGQPGYYAVDVTDPDIIRHNSSEPGPTHESTSTSLAVGAAWPPYMGTEPPETGLVPQGPHFLWQLTFQNPQLDLTTSALAALAPATDDTASRLFATNSVTPALTTVYIADPDDSAGTKREIGVAILPGGAATGPGSTSVGCQRRGAQGVLGATKVSTATPSGSSYQLTAETRMWGTSCTAAVSGRSVSIVRLDTGEVLRTFVQPADIGTKLSLMGGASWTKNGTTGYQIAGRVTEADFDSPMSGTPVPYPADIGALVQKVFISDQDGVVWRMNLSSTNPDNWYVEPFFDSFNTTSSGHVDNDAWAVQRSPLAGPPIVTVGRDGDLVLNFGTGDNNNIGLTPTLYNFAFSVSERPSSNELLASPNWTLRFGQGEMITGPATVFDGVYYFASYASSTTATSACQTGLAYLWGMDFVTGAGTDVNTAIIPAGTPSLIGGVAEMVNPNGGANLQKIQSTVPNVAPDPPGSAIIPGVAITSTAACAQTGTGVDPVTGGTTVSVSNVQAAQYSITGQVGESAATAKAGGSTNSVPTSSYALNGVKTATLVDSWASIVE